MKFGKYILSQQISGWGAYYLDYKFLKKIINSLEKGRLADAALFATGVRPEETSNGQPAVSPQPQILPHVEGSDELQIHKAAFFFKLERELEKINNFYLQKEAELKSRLQTLIDKKRIIFESRNSSKLSKESPSYVALYEGFRYFEKDLSKLQQFIEINATGFRKILKKWDKRSKSQTKELYLARQVEVQPCFNLKFIAELSDIAAANLLELENLSHGRSLNETLGTNGASLSSDNRLDFAAAQSQDFDALADLEANLAEAVKAGRVAPATEMIRIAAQNEDPTSVSRIVWRALLEAPHEAVRAALEHHLADYKFVDDISSRTCLHESSMAGKLFLVQSCIENGVDVAQQDIYGRTALSYAAMAGHTDVCHYLLSLPSISAATYDLDGFSPLILAVMNGRTDAVRILLDHGASVEPRDATDLIPLCLASSGGHADIVRLLLQKGAKIVSNAEGLYPQALAARAGHADCVRLLVESGGDPNAPEKGTQWTPTFFAAESGHIECLQVLLNAGCNVTIVDEKDRTAAFYAAWNGKIACLLLLLQAAQQTKAIPSERRLSKTQAAKASTSSDAADDLDLEIDGIPDLSLPPPIIPFRTYGHNYLDKRALVSVSLTNNSVKLYKHQDPNRPEQFSTSSLKLVMTSRPDASTTAIPHNVVLPLADEREVFSFQVDRLESFTIEWELMPTFGSKVIGKAVALPSSFEGMTDRKRFVLPLQDVYLKVVGEVSFELDFVKPFDSVQLEIGGRVETYWKSMLPGVASASNVGPTRMTPNSGVSGIGSSLSTATAAGQGGNTPAMTDKSTALGSGGAAAGGTPSLGSAGAASAAAPQPTLVTGSSLAGEYLRVVVQVTKDAIAVVWPATFIPLPGLQVYVGSVKANELLSLAAQTGHSLDWTPAQAAQASWTDWQRALQTSVVTLEKLLSLLPVSVGIDIDVMYPSTAEVRSNPGMPKMEVNQFVDTILHTVYAAGTSNREQSRKILFSSRSPTVCTALNWKQPNYAVFFAFASSPVMSSSISETELQEIYTFAIELSRKAGRAIVEGSSRRFASSAGFDQKKNTADLVTETDQAVETLVKREISTKFPDHDFIGEESWAAGEENVIGEKVTWIVDPIDGTTNFVHGFPFTCISIGIVVDQKPTIGVVYAPFMDTLYHACLGKGSFISSPHHPTPQRLPLASPQPLSSLNQALVAFEWGSDRRSEILSKKLSSFSKITGDPEGGVVGGKFAQGVRSIGSAALNFCHVASGSLDLYWEIGCWAWDVCAGVVIAQEAGAAVVGSQKHARDVIAKGDGFNVVTEQVLTGRKYVVVRAIDGQDEGRNREAQKHILTEFYGCVDEWEP